jgi:hypothetical protein
MRGNNLKLVLAATGLIAASAAFAEKNREPADPNRVICRYEAEVGSRLHRKKTCLTAFEWVQRQRDLRMVTDRVQQFKPYNGG